MENDDLGLNKLSAEMPLVSVVMPVYNSELYLDSAIKSVLNQTYSNFELLIMDDGSTDNCPDIIDSYANNDNRIRVFHNDNHGQSYERNKGIEFAKGEWITFIDNDDVYDRNFLKFMIRGTSDKDVDIVRCGRKNIYIDNGTEGFSEICTFKFTRKMSIKEYAEMLPALKQTNALSSVWNCLYRKETLVNNRVLFAESMRHGNEDILFNNSFLLVSKKLYFLEEALYTHYIRRGHSISSSFNSDQVAGRIKCIYKEIEIIKKCDGPYDNISLVGLLGIRESFNFLNQECDESDKSRSIKLIEDKLSNKFLFEKRIIRYSNVISIKYMVDLVLLKYRWYTIYFAIHKFNKLLYKK